MWNLKQLADFDAKKHLDTVFADGEVTEPEKSDLLALYKRYVATNGRPSDELRAEGHRKELYELIHKAYGQVQDNGRLKQLRADLKLLADYCPYCGFAPISDLDHHLQRAHFKLLSIYPLNLVPCCSPCNAGKRRKPSDDPAKHQIHTYLDSLSNFDFLRAKASLHPKTGALKVQYSIEQCEGMSDELYRRLQLHLEEFDLQAKYNRQVNIHLGEHEHSMSSTFARGPEELRSWLVGTADANKKRFGANDWRRALFAGLALCPAFWSGGFRKALGLKDQPDWAAA
ncbi:hypothetical protein ACS5PK_18190 [Roseateles sp. DB2]|uniref:hypothetical protein n=1 Tax=Roseateles sp. DB2 TaxID=3453717 RepID=UPI003EEBDBA7